MTTKFKKYFFPIPTLFILISLLNLCLKVSYTKALVGQNYTYLEIEEGVQPSLAEAELAIDDEFRKVFTHYSNLEEHATRVTPRPTTCQSSKKGLLGFK